MSDKQQDKKEDYSQYKYTISKENKENFLNSEIKKENVTAFFSLSDIDLHVQKLEKFVTEYDAKARVHSAEMINIERNHPFVKDFDAKQLHTLGLYIDAIRELKKVEPVIEDAKKAIKEYAKEKSEIYKQCKIDISKLMEDNTQPI